MKKTIICILLSLMSGLAAVAQQFTVERFRPLPNDITAYMQPVKDLNGEACALVKVVGDKDFVFSSPLGIVKRVDEVGETWIYLPHGTRLLTLKHPRWGVLRNYRFPSPLESRLTYELVVLPPVQPVSAEGSIPFPRLHPAGFLPAPHDRAAVSGVPLRPRRIREPWRWVGLLHAGIGSGGSSFGLRLGAMRRHGVYVYGQSNFASAPSTQGECDEQGFFPDGSQPYYTGRTSDARYLLAAGCMHRLISGLHLYEGIGYGSRQVAWETSEGTYILNTDYSAQGVAAEAGLMWRWRMLMASAGASTIRGQWWEFNIGLGITF